jgi:hypothetical protein
MNHAKRAESWVLGVLFGESGRMVQNPGLAGAAARRITRHHNRQHHPPQNAEARSTQVVSQSTEQQLGSIVQTKEQQPKLSQ